MACMEPIAILKMVASGNPSQFDRLEGLNPNDGHPSRQNDVARLMRSGVWRSGELVGRIDTSARGCLITRTDSPNVNSLLEGEPDTIYQREATGYSSSLVNSVFLWHYSGIRTPTVPLFHHALDSRMNSLRLLMLACYIANFCYALDIEGGKFSRFTLVSRDDSCPQFTTDECDCSGVSYIECDVTADGWAVGLDNGTSTSTTSTIPISTTSSTQILAPTSPPPTIPCEDDCMAIIPQLSAYGDMVCTGTDLSKFIDHGTTNDASGNADWFRVSSHGNCFLVMAKSAAHRGFPDQYCFQKSALETFVQQNALGCNVGGSFNRMSGAQSQESQFSGVGEVCLANFANYQACGEKDL